ncbi:MAG: ferredoxin [Candidatus Pacearchaeota archaeon]
MPYKIKVDKNKCIGCGSCEAICPKSFYLKEGKATPKKEKVTKITCEEEAKNSCPVGAISIEKE